MTSLNGSVGVTFDYDAFDRRTSKAFGTTQVGTLYDGFREVNNYSTAASTSTLLNGPGLDERYARTQGGVTLSILSDALGSTMNLVKAAGAMTATFSYEPYGTTTQSGTDNTAFRFTGREEDGTGLTYFRARYYSPRLSRFVSEDLLPPRQSRGVSLSRLGAPHPVTRTWQSAPGISQAFGSRQPHRTARSLEAWAT